MRQNVVRKAAYTRSVFDCLSVPRRAVLVAAALFSLSTHVQAASAIQLQASTDSPAALLGGRPAQLRQPPRVVQGRTYLPLLEIAALLGRPADQEASQLSLGTLSVQSESLAVSLGALSQPSGSAVMLGDTLYISARLLASALNANLSFSDDGRILTLTALPEGGNPLSPQARFSTDKLNYAPGEKIIYTEYAFDPDGSELVSRKWTNRQDAFFEPGEYTVSLQVTNADGLKSLPYTRTVTISGAPIDTPLSYALKYAEPGESFYDSKVSVYPLLTAPTVTGPAVPLIFSNSPEAAPQSGLLYQDNVAGRVRVLAYHLNALGKPARLYLVARNLEPRAVTIATERLGETAPTRLESVLGQVTLLDYFSGEHTSGASGTAPNLTLRPGESVALYASPTLGPGSGVNVLQDLNTSGRVELSVAMLEDGLPPSAQVLQQLPYLQPDGKHQRGTFPNAVKVIRVRLGTLPARLAIGDGQIDPAVQGMDVLTGQPQRLNGNYGVLYDIQVSGAGGVAVALSPRGGLYRGAMQVQDGPGTQVIKLPRSGSALKPDQPTLLWRSQSDQLKIDFVPASGSNLPINLIFYPARLPGAVGEQRKKNAP